MQDISDQVKHNASIPGNASAAFQTVSPRVSGRFPEKKVGQAAKREKAVQFTEAQENE